MVILEMDWLFLPTAIFWDNPWKLHLDNVPEIVASSMIELNTHSDIVESRAFNF